MKIMTTLLLGVAAASMVGPARAFDAAPALTTAGQADVDAKAKVAEIEKIKVTDENKAQVAADLKAAKAAATASGKALTAAQRADAKAAEKVTKAEAAAKTESDKAAADEAKKAAAAAKQPEQNGITRPKADTSTGKAWAIFDEVSARNKAPASIGESLPLATAAGINEATTRTQYNRWRKFNGVSGRVEDPTKVKSETPPAPPAAPPAPPAPPAS